MTAQQQQSMAREQQLIAQQQALIAQQQQQQQYSQLQSHQMTNDMKDMMLDEQRLLKYLLISL